MTNSATLQSFQCALSIHIFKTMWRRTWKHCWQLHGTWCNTIQHAWLQRSSTISPACISYTYLFEEEHAKTVDSYGQLGVTQYNMHGYSAALQSHQRALAIRLKLFGEEHAKTADSYRQVKIAQDVQREKSEKNKEKNTETWIDLFFKAKWFFMLAKRMVLCIFLGARKFFKIC